MPGEVLGIAAGVKESKLEVLAQSDGTVSVEKASFGLMRMGAGPPDHLMATSGQFRAKVGHPVLPTSAVDRKLLSVFYQPHFHAS